MAQSITLIRGDGIGSEVVNAACKIIDATGVQINWEECEAGAEVFKKGISSGVPKETVESIKRTRLVFKGPLETPVGYGENSANVTLRKMFETYANVRPVRELPGIKGPYYGRKVDLVVVRENVEDLYGGIEYIHTPGVAETLKLISRKGCEKIIRFAFEYARSEGRKSVHCATKANIMKMTEGLMKRTFEDIAPEYPEIEAHHIIVDNCAHQMVMKPEQFEIIVTTNMNGDILSDLGSGLVGGLGFAPSANLGSDIAIFEAVHGSAPTIAGKNIANPTSVILSGAMMLRYLGEQDAANAIEQALLVTLEQGNFTSDVADMEGKGLSTTDFTDKIIGNLGQKSKTYPERQGTPLKMPEKIKELDMVRPKSRKIVGIDLFVESTLTSEELGKNIESLVEDTPMRLTVISNRGVKVYPNSEAQPDLVDAWRCRFRHRDENTDVSDQEACDLMQKVGIKHPWSHIKKLFILDGEEAYSKAQGE
ncbi:MAG: NADP-dependent isocitrate dehydrogenase [bacterium]|nr:NADP-dependent isocitrate dehydrogenase [bacterium]